MIEDISITVKPAFDQQSRYGDHIAQTKQNPDDVKTKEKHARLMEWWTQAREIESINRYQQAIDSDFKDGLPWSDEDQQELMNRGQAPLVYNKIKPAIDWILGTEKRTRIDFNVYPRNKEQNKEADAKKNLLKYVNDVNKTVFARSRAFDDAVTVGVGWLEDSIRGDESRELLQSRHESWRNIWYDPLSIERDLSDARYLFRSKFVDLDLAIAMFPKAKFQLEQAASTLNNNGSEQDADDDYFYSARFQQRDSSGNVLHRRSYANSAMIFNRRERVKLIECWYRDPISKKVIRGGDYDGKQYDPGNQSHVRQVQEEFASVADSLVMQMYCAIMTEGHILQCLQSPYDHNDFPFTPVWGYRRARDNAPYGVVRNSRDPQEDLNKRMSKALHILSTNQIIADEDAATDWNEIKDEAARPDGIILLDGRKGSRFELNNDKQLAEEHIRLMEFDAKMIQDISGVTDENMGRGTNAVSGKAITARQEQGSVVSAELFDNLRYAVQLQGEKQLSLVEQFYDQEKIIRIVGNKGTASYVPINQPQYDEQSGQWVTLNPMTANKASFVVDEQDYQASMRASMFEAMTSMMQTLPPEIALQLLDLVYDNSDLPGRDEIVARIRKINGQQDPNAEETPQMMAEQQAKAASEQQAQELEQRRIRLELDELQAKIDKLKSESIVKNIEGLYSSMQAAQTVATVPGVVPIADEIAKSAGFVDKNGYPLVNQSAQPVALPGQQPGMETMPEQRINTDPRFPPNPESASVGMMRGIETQANDA